MGVYERQCYGSESLVIRVYERQSYGSESLDMVVYECQCYEAEAGNWMVGQKEKNQKITVAKEKKIEKKSTRPWGTLLYDHYKLKQNEAQSARAESTHKGVN